MKCNLNITSRTSNDILFEKDPWVNQLRITTAALASAIGGSNRIICNNITHKLGQAPDFIKRLTRNTHIILQEGQEYQEFKIHQVVLFILKNLLMILLELHGKV